MTFDMQKDIKDKREIQKFLNINCGDYVKMMTKQQYEAYMQIRYITTMPSIYIWCSEYIYSNNIITYPKGEYRYSDVANLRSIIKISKKQYEKIKFMIKTGITQ